MFVQACIKGWGTMEVDHRPQCTSICCLFAISTFYLLLVVTTQVDLLENASEARMFENDEGQLVWPVMLFYPEYDQSDFVAQFCDATCFNDHFEVRG